MPDRFSLKTPTKWFKPNRNWRLNFKEPLKHCTFLDITIGTPGGNMSGYRCISDCRLRGCEFIPRLVPYFSGDFPLSFSSLLMNHSRRVVVCYKWKYVHEVLVYCLFKLAQEKIVVRWTDHPAMAIAVDLGHKATKQTNKNNWNYCKPNVYCRRPGPFHLLN